MATFEGTYTDILTVPTSVGATREHFHNLAVIVANTKDLEKGEIIEDVVHFNLAAQDYPGIGTFEGRYACRYTVQASGTMTWEPVGEGNVRQSGSVSFEPDGNGGTRVNYSETVSIDMDVPAMMAPLLKPLIGPMLRHEIAEFAKRMVRALK